MVMVQLGELWLSVARLIIDALSKLVEISEALINWFQMPQKRQLYERSQSLKQEGSVRVIGIGSRFMESRYCLFHIWFGRGTLLVGLSLKLGLN